MNCTQMGTAQCFNIMKQDVKSIKKWSQNNNKVVGELTWAFTAGVCVELCSMGLDGRGL